MNILVLGGGNSPEREVSLRSAKSVTEAAQKAGFNVQQADLADGFKIFDGLPEKTLVFPILHGIGGEDGVIQAELERRNLPFLGSNSRSSKNCFDKWQTRLVLQKNNIPVAKGERVTAQSYPNSPLRNRAHVLKVNHGGSTIGAIIVREPAKLTQQQIDEVFDLENDAIVEELIEGVEITVPILDQKALPPIEIHPPEGGEFDYENKYNGKSQELCPPPSLDEAQQKTAMELAEMVHKAMACRHLSRVDAIMEPDDSFVILEINTIPGLTDQSLYPKSALVSGLDMPALIKKFSELVKRDYNL